MTDEQARIFWYSENSVLQREQDEQYLVRQIKIGLLTAEQKQRLIDWNLTIEDLLNGRVEGHDQDAKYAFFFEAWNAKLGKIAFGG